MVGRLTTWAVRVCVLALVGTLGACDLSTSTSQEPGTALRTSGAAGTTEATLLGGGYTMVSDGPFELFASWRDPWDSGTCVDLFVRNTGPVADVWTITITLDAAISSLSYTSATTHHVYVDAGRLVIVPITPLRLASGEGETIAYCAEPRTRPVALAVEAAGSSAGTNGTNPSGLAGFDTLEDEGFTLYVAPGAKWEGGGCASLTLQNQAETAVRNWRVELDLAPAIDQLDSVFGAHVFPASASRLLVTPTDPTQPLPVNAMTTFGFCSEPLPEITAFRASAEAVPEEEGPGETDQPAFFEGELKDPATSLAFHYRTPTKGADDAWCFDFFLRNDSGAPMTIDGFVLTFAADTELSKAGWPAEVSADAADALRFEWPAAWGDLEPGSGNYTGALCLDPMTKPFLLTVL